MPASSPGLAHFLAQTDAVGLGVLAVLAAMSLLSWYTIAVKLWQSAQARGRSRAFLACFQRVRSPDDAERLWMQEETESPPARLLGEGLSALQLIREARQMARHSEECAAANPDDFLGAALHRGVSREYQRLENGLTVLASIAASAPFIGLFGTVWGIYHALIAIGLAGEASLDQVAGPVGEALIMTACGLFVAIPALLAYNAFVRLNRNFTDALEDYAHDLFGLLFLGRLTPSPRVARQAQASPAGIVLPRTEGAC
jgi:biopolymer transport protein ExbB